MSMSAKDVEKQRAYETAFFMTCLMYGKKTPGTAKRLVKFSLRYVCRKKAV